MSYGRTKIYSDAKEITAANVVVALFAEKLMIETNHQLKCIIKLHKINYFYPDGNNFNYNLEDIMEETN